MAQFTLGPGQHDRPEGLHVSDIITDIMKTLEPKKYGKPGGPDVIKIQSGLAFEEALEKTFKPGSPGAFRPPSVPVWTPGYSVQWQGKPYPGCIWVTPDHVEPDETGGNPWIVREFKLTWYSSAKEFPSDDVYFAWLSQIKAYCYALETPLAILTVLYINGDYKPPTPKPPQSYGLEFTKLELVENWQMICNHALVRGWLVPSE